MRGSKVTTQPPGIQAVLDCAASLTREGFHPRPWANLMHQEPEPSRDNAEPGPPRKGWQKGQRSKLMRDTFDTPCAPS